MKIITFSIIATLLLMTFCVDNKYDENNEQERDTTFPKADYVEEF